MAFAPYIARNRRFHDYVFDFHIENETGKSWYDGSPEQHMPERDWCWQQIRPGMTVVDCGAHHGMLSLIFARAVGPYGRVIAYEALPENAAVIGRNAALNGVANIHVRPVGVGSAHAVLGVNFNASNTVVLSEDGAPAAGQSSIEIVRLDDDLPEGLRVDLLKVDVEGHDLHALRGMQRTLAQRPILDLELHNFIFEDRAGTVRAIVELLRSLGYRWSLLGEIHQQPVPLEGELTAERLLGFDNPHLLGVPTAD